MKIHQKQEGGLKKSCVVKRGLRGVSIVRNLPLLTFKKSDNQGILQGVF